MKTKFFYAGMLFFVLATMSACSAKSELQSTISVFGTGTVIAQPDTIQMTITLSKVAQTTKSAQDAVTEMARQVLAILKASAIQDKNISTAALAFRSEYEYTTKRTLLGQKAEQTITFSSEVTSDNEKASGIIDQLIQINGIELNQIQFSIKNNTDYFSESRELAFKKASDKANQYAKLANRKILKTLRVAEERNQASPPINSRMQNTMALAMDSEGATGGALIPSGALEITTIVSVVFLLD